MGRTYIPKKKFKHEIKVDEFEKRWFALFLFHLKPSTANTNTSEIWIFLNLLHFYLKKHIFAC